MIKKIFYVSIPLSIGLLFPIVSAQDNVKNKELKNLLGNLETVFQF